ncbi:MAG: glucosidase, partial [Verrucomicrobiota bacterium]
MDPESTRLAEDAARKSNWKRWGPYLSERQWGTVREDYSASGNCWEYFPFEHSHLRTYRWGEDGLFGITDRQCRLCFSIALWNGKDPVLKERLFGLTGPQGNHGEDVKECYYYLDSTPTHSYLKGLYKYPQKEFPYQNLKEENQRRGKSDAEYELEDTGIFAESRYFDVQTEYAKNSPDDILIRITLSNRGPEEADLHFLPTLWFRNTWAWGCTHDGCEMKPKLSLVNPVTVQTQFSSLGNFCLSADEKVHGKPSFLFTENESNFEALFKTSNAQPYVKDAFHRWLIQNDKNAVNPKNVGTKCAAHWKVHLKPGESKIFRFRLTLQKEVSADPFSKDFDECFQHRIDEANQFYNWPGRKSHSEDADRVARQAYAGLLWSKQFYHFAIKDWMYGDPSQ